MNANRRAALADLRQQVESAIALLEGIKDDVEVARDEEQEYLDNMPESIRNGDKGQAAEEAVQAMDEIMDALSYLGDQGVDGHFDVAAA